MQRRSEIHSNQAFEGVKFISIVNSTDIFGISFLTPDFLFSIMSYRKYHCRWSTKHERPSFGQQDIHNRIKTPIEDLCCSEPGYLTEVIHIFITWGDLVSTLWNVWVIQTQQICSIGLNIPKNKNKKNEDKKHTEKQNFLALACLFTNSRHDGIGWEICNAIEIQNNETFESFLVERSWNQ